MLRILDRLPIPRLTKADWWLIWAAIIILGAMLVYGIIDTLKTFAELERLTEVPEWLS